MKILPPSWVEVFHRGPAQLALDRLFEEANRNIETRHQQITSESKWERPKLTRNTENRFAVVYKHEQLSDELSVLFRVMDRRTIHVNGAVPDEFDVQVKMNDDGQCVILIDGKPREPWEVMREAIGGLLFPDVDDPYDDGPVTR